MPPPKTRGLVPKPPPRPEPVAADEPTKFTRITVAAAVFWVAAVALAANGLSPQSPRTAFAYLVAYLAAILTGWALSYAPGRRTLGNVVLGWRRCATNAAGVVGGVLLVAVMAICGLPNKVTVVRGDAAAIIVGFTLVAAVSLWGDLAEHPPGGRH